MFVGGTWNPGLMRLQISQDDELGFRRAREWLLDGFGCWLRDELTLDDGLAEIAVGDAGIVLDWKFGYGDGHLGRWRTDDVAEFLLRWCPRKLSVSPQDSVTIPGSVAIFTDFLAARGLLAGGSSVEAALRAAAVGLAEDFVAEMADPANFGMAKSLFAAAAERGHDLSDEADLAGWMNEFNSLSEDERGAILADPSPRGGMPRPPLPPVVLPAREVIEESRASAPVLGMFAKLAEFAGAGRRLTRNGNLTLADARELVGLLGTGDVVDERIGGKVFLTRSSVDLPVLHLVFIWAKKARVIRVRHGLVLATRRGMALAANPAAMFDAVVDALFDAGPVTMQRHPKAWPFWPDVDRAVDEMVLPLLTRPYAERRPVPLDELAEVAAQAVLSMFTFGPWPQENVTVYVGSKIAAVMDALELAGVVRRVLPDTGDHEPSLRRQGGDVELTPAGLATMVRHLAALGFDVPVAGRLAEASAAEMLAGADRDDWVSLFAEIDAWRQCRKPDEALAELAEAVRKLDDPGLQNTALTIMSGIGPELAEPYVRELAGERPAVRGFALCWLADHGLLDASVLYSPGDLETFAYVLAHRLVTAGNDGLLACLAVAGDETSQVQLVTELGRKAGPPAVAVLDAIGGSHPDKPVAKAARKALFVTRSRLASQASSRQ